MFRFRQRRSVTAAAIVAALSLSPASAEDCRELIDQFNVVADGGHAEDAQALIDRIAVSAACGRYQVVAQRRLAALRLSAAQAYDRGIEIIKNETLTPTAPARHDIEELIQRAGQARLLAANDTSGRGAFVKATRDQRDGTLGGFYSRAVRGIVTQAIPVPITFEYRTTAFTGVGQDAARELLDVLKEQTPSRIVLIGHTDVRGTAEFNLKLSRERAEAVAAFLQQNGISAPIATEGRGANEPLQLSDSSGLSQDDIYALNRRVEWRRQ